jgi:CheY-like chemotaxis protein
VPVAVVVCLYWHGTLAGGERLVDVAVINTSEELAELLELVLREEGWTTARGYIVDFKRERQDLAAFLATHDPRVLVWDIAIPYVENWAYYQTAQQLPAAAGRRFILTTTNVLALEQLVGGTAATEIIGKPFDLQQLCDSVKQALAETSRAP